MTTAVNSTAALKSSTVATARRSHFSRILSAVNNEASPIAGRRRGLSPLGQLREEEDDLGPRRLGRIRTVDRVRLDRFGEILADGAGRGLGRVGGAHDLAVEGDGVLALQHLNDNRAGDHEGDEVVEERRSEEHTSELQSLAYLVCRLLLEKKN